MSLKKYKKTNNDQLVTDQSGRFIFFMGLLISLTLGFTIRGLTSSKGVHQKLQEATKALGKTTTISWSQAQFSFRNGILIPQLAVKVQNVKVVSEDPCWGKPLIYAKEVELPLSLSNWISQGQPLQSLVIKESFLEFRSLIQCDSKDLTSEVLPEVQASKSVRMKSKAEGVSRPPLVLKDFRFEGVKIRNPQWILTDWNIKNIRLQVQENQPWYVTLTSNFAIPETDGVDSDVNLKIVYKEFPESFLDVSLKGNWREGSFDINGDWQKSNQSWNLKTQFNNFPFQFLKILANKTKTPWNWPDRPMWFSFISESSNKSLSWKSSKHLLRNIIIEGDLGELKTPDMRIESLQPFQVAPFVFNIEQVDLETSFRPLFKNIKEIKNLGNLTGQGEWISQNELRFRGDWTNSQWSLKNELNFISDFIIQQSTVQAQLVQGQWTMSVLNPELNGQNLFGDLVLKGPQNLKTGTLSSQLRSEKWPFSFENDQTVINSQNFKLTQKMKWDKSTLSHQLSLNFTSLESENANFENINFDILKNSDGYEIKSQAEKFVLKKVVNPEFQKIEAFNSLPLPMGYSTLQAKFDSEKNLLSWNLNLPLVNSSGKLEKESGSLKGQVNTKNGKLGVSGSLDSLQIR